MNESSYFVGILYLRFILDDIIEKIYRIFNIMPENGNLFKIV